MSYFTLSTIFTYFVCYTPNNVKGEKCIYNIFLINLNKFGKYQTTSKEGH